MISAKCSLNIQTRAGSFEPDTKDCQLSYFGWQTHIPFQFRSLCIKSSFIPTHFPSAPISYDSYYISPIFITALFFFIFILPIRHTPSPYLITFELPAYGFGANYEAKQGNKGVWKIVGLVNGSAIFLSTL